MLSQLLMFQLISSNVVAQLNQMLMKSHFIMPFTIKQVVKLRTKIAILPIAVVFIALVTASKGALHNMFSIIEIFKY